jgi:hypothetical protein
MAPKAAAGEISSIWTHHVWSPQAVKSEFPMPVRSTLTVVSAAITSSLEFVELASNEDNTVLLIHKDLLRLYSPYYAAAFNGSFIEAQQKRFEVELSSEALKSFVAWLYTGELTHHTAHCDVDLYIFADKVNILALRRLALDNITEQNVLTYEEIRSIHTNLPGSSPLRRHTLDCYIAHWEPEADKEDPCTLDSEADSDNILADFMYEVAKGLAKHRNLTVFDCSCHNSLCKYHEHENKEEWEASALT